MKVRMVLRAGEPLQREGMRPAFSFVILPATVSYRPRRCSAYLVAAVLAGVVACSDVRVPFPAPHTSAESQQGLDAALAAISGERLLADVRRLSDPTFNGRQTGTPSDLASALHIVERFRSLGLRPAGIQPAGSNPEKWLATAAVTLTQIADHPSLEVQDRSGVLVRADPARDYLPVLDSPSLNVDAPMIFLGYGISDPASGFDEYQGLNVRDKVVLFLRGKPDRYTRPVTHAEKVQAAKQHGAIGYLTATGPLLSSYEARRGIGTAPLAFYGSAQAGAGRGSLPGGWISTTLAERLMAGTGRTLRQRQDAINQTLHPESAALEVRVRLHWDSREETGVMANVLGMLPPLRADRPSDRDEIVIVGAHRDHFGRQAGLLFPGADDNASGTAAMLEVARILSQSKRNFRRAILFISFSGEEQALLGSRLYVREPYYPLTQTTAMLNIDHAGTGNGRLTLGVTGFSQAFIRSAAALAGLSEAVDIFGFFPGGDHVPFKEADVPTVTIVSGGPHPHFHQPTDTAETVQAEILKTAVRYLLTLTWQLADKP